MTEPVMPEEAKREWEAEEQRHTRALVGFVQRWPNFRLHVAYGLLGGAVAVVDMMGGDAEGFLAQLRTKEPRPRPLTPPGGS